MARAYFYVLDQGRCWTVRYESRNYGMFASEEAAYSQATQWARDQGKEGHDSQVFTRGANGKYRARWLFGRDPYPAETLYPGPPLASAMTTPLTRALAAAALALVLSASGLAAEEFASGSVEICRQTGIVDANTGKPIGIPPGATFVDNGMFKGTPGGDTARRLRIATTEPAQIAANAACTVTRARVSENDTGVGVSSIVGKRLSPARSLHDELASWPGNLYLFATIAPDFR